MRIKRTQINEYHRVITEQVDDYLWIVYHQQNISNSGWRTVACVPVTEMLYCHDGKSKADEQHREMVSFYENCGCVPTVYVGEYA